MTHCPQVLFRTNTACESVTCATPVLGKRKDKTEHLHTRGRSSDGAQGTCSLLLQDGLC